MKLINVDDIDWQEGVFVNPTTKEPLPIIHKIATIEMLRDWQEEVKAIRLAKVKQAREEVENEIKFWSEPSEYNTEIVAAMKHAKVQSYKRCLEILDKLIESEKKE